MGKSPGRWIKAVLFGKKHFKSRQFKNATSEKRSSLSKAVEDPEDYSMVISTPHQLTENGASNVELEKDAPAALSNATSSAIQGSETEASSVPLSDAETQRRNQAAATAQAAFKGYLARRAFRALKGIIRLQALIRGHLVRRQAVATLHCIHAIVKLQAVVRGRNVRLCDGADEGLKKFKVNVYEKSSFNAEKLAKNPYISKLLGSVATAMPLKLQYEKSAPNAYSNWLDRWSVYRIWAPPALPRRFSTAKSKRTIRRADSGQNADIGMFPSLEMDGKKNLKKGYNHQAELVKEPAEIEFKRIKRNLRKIPETAVEKPKKASQPVEKVIDPEKPANPVTKANGIEAVVVTRDEEVDVPENDLSPVDPNKTDENMILPLHEEFSPKTVDVKLKVRDRKSFPGKPEFIETPTQNTPPTLPSYMAATESAKAKLRSSGSSRIKEDGVGFGHVRRHSLPSSLTGKFTTSLSPRIQQPNGKGSNKSNRSMLSSRDDKAIQPGWKR